MECKITGEYRWKEMRGFGPFKKEVWFTEPFTCVVGSEKPQVAPIDELRFGCVRSAYGYVIEGSIKGIACMFDEFKFGSTRTHGRFNMISIANVDVTGEIEVLGGVFALSMARGFAA